MQLWKVGMNYGFMENLYILRNNEECVEMYLNGLELVDKYENIDIG